MYLLIFAYASNYMFYQIIYSLIIFEHFVDFFDFLARMLALTCKLPDEILVDFRRDIELNFSRSNMEFAISQPKMVQSPRN